MPSEDYKLLARGSTPPGGFSYTLTVNGKEHTLGPYMAIENLMANIREMCLANDILPPSQQDVINILCTRLPRGWCFKQGAVASRGAVTNFAALTFDAVMQFTRTMANWLIMAGGRPVADDQIRARASVCTNCPQNKVIGGCKNCFAMSMIRKFIEVMFKHRKLPEDANLNVCAVCKCSLKVKTRIPLDIILQHMPQQQIDQLPDFCWVKKEQVK